MEATEIIGRFLSTLESKNRERESKIVFLKLPFLFLQKKFNGRSSRFVGAKDILPEVSGRIAVYIRVPQSSGFDEGS